jgi:hypothetical protein
MFLFVFLLLAFLLVRNTANNIKRTGATDFRSVPFPPFSETVTNPKVRHVCVCFCVLYVCVYLRRNNNTETVRQTFGFPKKKKKKKTSASLRCRVHHVVQTSIMSVYDVVVVGAGISGIQTH